MALDGSLEVAWKGQAFPYLFHHPKAGAGAGDSYGSAAAAAAVTEPHQHGPAAGRGGTGTWDGPAPRGQGASSHALDEASTTGALACNDLPDLPLSSGFRMPLVGLGTYLIDSPEAIRLALAAGYRHLDCAAKYENEPLIGQAIAEFVAAGGRREELFVTSKVWNDAHRPASLRASAEKSLSDLGCGYLDLFLIHWPDSWLPGSDPTSEGGVQLDPEASLAETWAAMEDLVAAGLVRSIGVSNFSVTQVEEVLRLAKVHKPAVNQVELHPALAQRKLVGVCLRKGVTCVAYAPLGSHNSKDLLNHPAVGEVAKRVGKTPAQVLLRWNLQRGVPVIPKASGLAHLEENIDLLTWRLSNQDKVALDALDSGTRYITASWHDWGNPEDGGVTKPSLVL